MAEVECDVEFIELTSEEGFPVPSVCVTCLKCGHETESYGEGPPSIRRCLALLREECPERERNFYTVDEEYLED